MINNINKHEQLAIEQWWFTVSPPGQRGAIHWKGGDASGSRLLWQVLGLGHQDGMKMMTMIHEY